MSTSRLRLWPDLSDELLLRGSLLDGPEAIAAWQRWHNRADYERLDYTQLRMLPVLYANLRKQGVSHPILHRYRATMRRFWAENQVLYHHAAHELQALDDLNVQALVLKGVPISLQFYEQPGLRPMSDIDVLVAPANVRPAAQYFLRKDWFCSDDFIESMDDLDRLMEVRHGFNLRGPEGQEIDLHWNIFQTCFADPSTLWEGAVGFEVHGFQASTLCPTDHLLHACSQAAGWNIVRPIRWIPDAAALITRSEIEWPRLEENARHFDLAEPAYDALTVLRELLGVEVPAATLAKFKSVRTRFVSRMDYRLSARQPWALVGRPLQRYFRYLRTARPLGLTFRQYMMQLWGVSSVSRLVKLGVQRIWSSRSSTK